MMPNLSRRELLGMAGAAMLPLLPMGRFAAAGPASGSNAHIIDLANGPFMNRDAPPKELDSSDACTQINTKFLQALSNAGIDTILRYYSDSNNAGLNCKNITKRERAQLHDAGFAVGIVYQFAGRIPNRYTGARANQDADFCLSRAKVLDQPEGSAIYFGVDSDTGSNSDNDVKNYFTIIKNKFDGRYKVGIYAAGARCKLIKKAVYRSARTGRATKGLADFFWVPEAPAWDGTREFMNSGAWTLYQCKTDVQKSSLSRDMGQEVKLDVDFINPLAKPTIGAFNKDGSEKTYAPDRIRTIAERRLWVNADTVNLHKTPGGAVVGHMCIARIVHVLAYEGDWAKVDIDEDGIENGYCLKSQLAPLASMPKYNRACTPHKL